MKAARLPSNRLISYFLSAIVSLALLAAPDIYARGKGSNKGKGGGDKCYGHDKCREHDKCRDHEKGHRNCKPKVDKCKDHDRCKDHDKCREHDRGHDECKPKVDKCKDHDRCKEHDKCREHDRGHGKCKPKVDKCKDHDRCRDHDKCREHDRGHDKCAPKVDKCKDRCVEHKKCRQHDRGHETCRSQLEVSHYSGQAIVVHLTNLLHGPPEVLIGDTGALGSGGGTLEAEVNGTNVQDFLLIDLARATTIGQGSQSMSEVSIEEFTLRILATNGTLHTVTFESMQVSTTAECGTTGPSVSGSVSITGLKVDDEEITITGEENQRIDYDGGFILVNARSSRVVGGFGEITVAGLYIHNDGCMEGPIGLAHSDINCESSPPPSDCLKITGSGAIDGTPSGDKGAFCLTAGKRHNAFWGRLQYLDYDTCTWVKSTCVTSIARIDDCTYAIEYKVKIKINDEDGTARVEVSDYSKSGKDDVFKIELSNGYEAVRIANTTGSGAVEVEWVRITVYWQRGGGDWRIANPQSFSSELEAGTVVNKSREESFDYEVDFSAPSEAREYRSVAEVKLVGRDKIISDTRHFFCGGRDGKDGGDDDDDDD